MRCPECSQRNSVAAKKCAACGSSLSRKPLPLALKVFVGTLVGLIFVLCLAALSTTIINPDKAMTNAATTLTGKSKSVEQMMDNFKRFDQSMRSFLQKYGSLTTEELSSKLSTSLPKTYYEDHIFELLPNLKLVEIDTALNASNYLILLTNGKTEVLPVIGLDVYDRNSFLPQRNKPTNDKKANEGQLLVLLGHSAGIHGHHPRVKVLLLSSTLQSDNVVDLTDTAVPKIYGEGIAKFSPNQKDIELSMSLLNRGQELQLFSPIQTKASLPIENESLYEQLLWQNNNYSLRSQPGTSKLYALYAVASALQNHNKLWRFRPYLSIGAKRTIAGMPAISSEQGFKIASYSSGKNPATTGNIYELRDDSTKVIVELRPIATGRKGPGNISWFVNSLSISHAAPVPPTVATTALSITATAPIAAPVAPISPAANTKTVLPKAIETKGIENKISQNKMSQIDKNKTRLKTAEIKATEIKTVENKAAKSRSAKEEKAIVNSSAQAMFVPELANYIKLRNGPATTYKSLLDINPNTHFTIIGKEAGWYRIKVDNKEGYVYAGLVSNHKGGAYTGRAAKRSGVVRDEQQHTIANVRSGEHLVLLGRSKNNRYKVILSNGKIGYVSKEAIDGTSEAPPPSVP